MSKTWNMCRQTRQTGISTAFTTSLCWFDAAHGVERWLGPRAFQELESVLQHAVTRDMNGASYAAMQPFDVATSPLNAPRIRLLFVLVRVPWAESSVPSIGPPHEMTMILTGVTKRGEAKNRPDH
jgi:hypothetical protein